MEPHLAVEDVGALASKLYRKCRDCPEEQVAAVAPGLRQTSNTLEDLEDHLTTHPLSDVQDQSLTALLWSIRALLNQVQGLVKEVSVSPAVTRDAWSVSNGARIKQVKVDIEDIANKTKDYYASIIRSNEGRLSRALSSLVRDGDEKRLKLLRRSVYNKDKAAWNGILAELEAEGVDKSATAAHQSFVESWVRKALPALEEDSEPEKQDSNSECHPSDSNGNASAPEDKTDLTHSLDSAGIVSTSSKQSTVNNGPRHDSILKSGESKSRESTVLSDNSSASNMLSDQEKGPINDEEPTRCEQPQEESSIHKTPGSSISQSMRASEDPAGTIPAMAQSSEASPMDQQQVPTFQGDSNEIHKLAIPSESSVTIDDDGSDDDLFGSTPVDRRAPRNSFLTDGIDTPTSKFRSSLPPKMESTVSGPLPFGLFEHDGVTSSPPPSHTETLSSSKEIPLSSVLLVNDIMDVEKQVVEVSPPVPPKESFSIRSGNNRNTLGLQISSGSSPLTGSGPPSPMTDRELDLKRNAEEIVTSVIMHKWSDAQSQIQKQINGVENGSFVMLNGVPVQPSIKFLTFLQGVCLSFHGDFVEAKNCFDKVLKDVYVRNYHLDAIEAAAAKWLGDTCILLHQSMNAALAYSVCLGGIIASFGDADHRALILAQDIRFLNQHTGSLQILRNVGQGFAGLGFNQDPTTVFVGAPAAWKRSIVFNTLDYCYKVYPSQVTTPDMTRMTKASMFTVEEAHLLHPVVAFAKFPFDHDPFFSASNATSLLAAVSKPKSSIKIDLISTSSPGRSKSLFFKTDRGAQWLIDKLRQSLDAYAIEYKIVQNNFLLRLSQKHSRIAYYQCFSIRLRKLPFRKTYGLKMTCVLLETRSFDKISEPMIKTFLADPSSALIDVPPNAETTRNGLMLRLASYLEECEKPDGNPEVLVAELPNNQRFELPDTAAMVPELQAATVPVEMEAGTLKKKWWKKDKKAEMGNLPPNVVELPA